MVKLVISLRNKNKAGGMLGGREFRLRGGAPRIWHINFDHLCFEGRKYVFKLVLTVMLPKLEDFFDV